MKVVRYRHLLSSIAKIKNLMAMPLLWEAFLPKLFLDFDIYIAAASLYSEGKIFYDGNIRLLWNVLR